MQQLQYDSFYKFMVSAGITLVVAPTVLLFFLVSGKEAVILSREEMASLCPESAELVYRRFTYLSFLYKYTLVICITLFALGAVLIIFGCIKWWKIQKELDERTSLEVDEIRSRVNQMTAPEIERKATGEVDEMIGDSIKLNKRIVNNGKQYSNAIMKYIAIEDKCFKTVKNENQGEYIFKQNASVRNEEIDILAIAKGYDTDLIYEVKYWVNVPSKALIDGTVGRLLKKKDSYESYMGRNAKPILMVVTEKDNIDTMKNIMDREIRNDHIEIRIEDEKSIS